MSQHRDPWALLILTAGSGTRHPAMHLPVPAVFQITNPTVKKKKKKKITEALSFTVLIKTINKLCKLQRTIPASAGCKNLHERELQADEATLTRPRY